MFTRNITLLLLVSLLAILSCGKSDSRTTKASKKMYLKSYVSNLQHPLMKLLRLTLLLTNRFILQ